jgi:hypothetical protein
MQKNFCAGKNTKKKRCKLFAVLQDKMPPICTKAKEAAAKKAKKAKKEKIAKSSADATAKNVKAKHTWGAPHLFNLTPKQKAYQGSVNDVVKYYCVSHKKQFCKQAKTLQKSFQSALKLQMSQPYGKKLKMLQSNFCKAPNAPQKTKRCQVMGVLTKTMVSVAHMGPYAVDRVTKLQVAYLKQTKDIYSHYCSVDDKSLFCQLCRGLERTYKLSLKHKTNILYEGYLTNMEKKYCGSPALAKQNEKRCHLFPILRRSMPISMTTLKTLPEKHLEFVNTVSDVQTHLCKGKVDTSLFCEVARGLKRVYLHGLNGEDNSDFDFYLSQVNAQFCAMPTAANQKACKILPVLKNGVPPPFLAEGVKRPIDGTNARALMAQAQAELHRKLVKDRTQYLQTLEDIHKHYCTPSDRTYFCMLTSGLVKNYRFSLSKLFENWEYRHYLMHMKRDFCVRAAADGFHKRCKFIPMLIQGLPMSINAEKRLFHEQNEYLKAMQDIVGHFCHLTTKSVFCQLCHGLVRHYVTAVAAHNNRRFGVYLSNMNSMYCVEPGSQASQRRCKVFPVLQKGIPGTGLEHDSAIASADTRVAKARAAVRAAQQIRAIAQKSVKKTPTKQSLAAFESATHRELAAEKVLQDAVQAKVQEQAQQAGSPSAASVQRALRLAKRLEGRAVRAKSASAMAKTAASEQLTKAKAKVLQTTLKLAHATSAVKDKTSLGTIQGVKSAMQASVDAKASLQKVVSFTNNKVKAAEQEAKTASGRAVNARNNAAKLKRRREGIIASFALRRAQKSALAAAKMAAFAKLNAKQTAEKLSWAKSLAKHVPTAENQAQVVQASQNAQKAAHAVKAAAGNALALANKASKKAEAQRRLDANIMSQAATARAQAAVHQMQAVAAQANNKASDAAAKAPGGIKTEVTKKLQQRASKDCAVANGLRPELARKRTALQTASAALKSSLSSATLDAIKAARRAYKTTRHKFVEAKKLCQQSQAAVAKITQQLPAPAKKPLSGHAHSAVQVVEATEQAARASAAVTAAKDEEAKRVNAHLSRLKQELRMKNDKAREASAKAATAQTHVSKLTTRVAQHPTTNNIQSLQQAMSTRKAAILAKAVAERSKQKAKDVYKAAVLHALATSSSQALKQKLRKQLKRSSVAAVAMAKKKFASAMAASKKAQATASAKPTLANVRAAKAASMKATKEKQALATASGPPVTHGAVVHTSVKSLTHQLQVALRKKRASKRYAMAHPSDANLDAFRSVIRHVHEIQARLMVAKQQQSVAPTNHPSAKASTNKPLPSQPGKDKKGEDLVSTLLAYYCSHKKWARLCAFYKQFQKTGWKDTTGQLSKQLLKKVAEAKKHLHTVKVKLSSARATSTSNPTKQNTARVKSFFKEFKSASQAYNDAVRIVRRFMQHQSELNLKMKSSTSGIQAKMKKKIAKLITFYCSRNNKYAKLCNFYKQLRKKHAKVKET